MKDCFLPLGLPSLSLLRLLLQLVAEDNLTPEAVAIGLDNCKYSLSCNENVNVHFTFKYLALFYFVVSIIHAANSKGKWVFQAFYNIWNKH